MDRDQPNEPALTPTVAPADLESLRTEIEQDPLHREILTPRLDRMLEVALGRLASVTIVLESLWDPHNAAAVVRSAEGLGLDEVHVVEEPHRYRRHPRILRGSDRWISIVLHPALDGCLDRLEERGFLVCAADVGAGSLPLAELPIDRPLAVVLGSEKDGLSVRAKERATLRFKVPMPGFTQSFNASVSAAITLFELTARRRRCLGRAGDLDLADQVARVHGWMVDTRARRVAGHR